MKSPASNKIKIWFSAFRLRTLPLATAGIGLGSFLAAAEGAFEWSVALLCLTTAIVLQILSNIANDYGDSQHGADSRHRKGPARAVQSGRISKSGMRAALAIFVILALGVGYPLVENESLLFHVAGLAAILAAVAYTVGPKPYAYSGLGDVFVFIFFGLVSVGGSYYLQTHTLNLQVLLPATSCGIFCVAVLNVNNIRDLESDRLAGKITIPVRLGINRARFYHWTLLFLGTGSALVFTVVNFKSPWQLLFLITLPLIIINGAQITSRSEASTLDGSLRQMVLITLLFTVTFGLGLLL